jgi:hypothetical protein
MNETERFDYIFRNPSGGVANLFGWVEYALLGDLRTFVDAIRNSINDSQRFPSEKPRGAGNLSIPILVCTGLELVSAMYCGKTRAKDNWGYHADKNVKEFLEAFMPCHAVEISKLLWDGIRNGIDHLFYPKFMKFKGK